MYLYRLLVHPLSSVAVMPLFLYQLNTIVCMNWIFTEGTDATSDDMHICTYIDTHDATTIYCEEILDLFKKIPVTLPEPGYYTKI